MSSSWRFILEVELRNCVSKRLNGRAECSGFGVFKAGENDEDGQCRVNPCMFHFIIPYDVAVAVEATYFAKRMFPSMTAAAPARIPKIIFLLGMFITFKAMGHAQPDLINNYLFKMIFCPSQFKYVIFRGFMPFS